MRQEQDDECAKETTKPRKLPEALLSKEEKKLLGAYLTVSCHSGRSEESELTPRFYPDSSLLSE
jgi:hypothetical protein